MNIVEALVLFQALMLVAFLLLALRSYDDDNN